MGGTANNTESATFWEHLDELRSVIIRILIVAMVIAVAAFCFKDILFAIVLAPHSPDFITYEWFEQITRWCVSFFGADFGNVADASNAAAVSASYASSAATAPDTFSVKLINTELAQQFIIHMKVAFAAGILLSSPYILYEVFRFISPALYQNERRYAIHLVGGAYVMFLTGAAFSYFVIFPFTFRFLGTYQVADFVENTITLESYISTMMALTLALGLVFEMPVMSWLLAKMHLLQSSYMVSYRKHVVVAILIAAAIITPTSDAFTLMIVSFPMWLLYELSIIIVRRVNN